MATYTVAGKAVTIIGAGTQGRRLAYMWSSRGNAVYLVDPLELQLEQSRNYIEQLRASSTFRSPIWGSVIGSSPDKLQEALRESWLAVECIPEKLPIKKSIVAKIADLAPTSTIIASNSSSYTIAAILNGMKLQNDERILSMHSYWPPEIPDIEIMGHKNTNPSVVSLIMEQCKIHHFSPFHVKRDSTGYIYNRIWAAIKRETLLALSEGVATPEEIDAIFKSVLKTPKGPCEQMDVVGLDVVLDIEEHYAEERKGIPEAPRTYLRSLIEEGRLGVKNGHGFYEYNPEKS